jgi:hypothetical membrane protein
MNEPVQTDALRKTLATCGLLGPVVAFSTIFFTTWLHADWFTWTGHALSDLGNVEQDHFWVYNLGLLTSGTLGVGFSVRLIDGFDSAVSRLGAVVFLLGTFSLGLVGAFPSGVDHHRAVTAAFFSLSTLGILIVGIGESIDGDRLGYVWIALVIVGLVFAELTSRWFSGPAIPEMVGALVYSAFSVGYFLRLRRHGW